MSGLKAGDAFPEGVSFQYVPPTGELDLTACGLAVPYNASEEAKNKKIVFVSVPGAFTPTCQEQHVVSYLKNRDALKAKGVDQVVFLAFNDHWVMAAWGKANGVSDDSILFVSDPGAAFSKSIGWTAGERTARYAIIVDNGKVVYAERDTVPKSIENTGAEAILARL
ncbi:alkyl hydroperoxide reductase 1 [Sporothrix brasiliensis 5110]|uniref:Alkyl hydroperoxide reductase 1 n=1 Tax=Sporothrix brasiliensis 5110 TaxID=1398154 RepID=A0A0C2FQH0_9PEZI|nr:alkyl hydroperoxide reductase 1 [Sporothrix brasiliensis 5110]KIH93298.1 alkyl hydroperoxide reductase 1 [Sporothrix brasiliensis 5110]